MRYRKPVVAIAVGAAGLALIGLGVRASFTTSVTVNQTITTGSVTDLITNAQWATSNVDGGETRPIEVGGAPFPNGVSSVNLGTSANNGSRIDEYFIIKVKNTGTLPATLDCIVTAGSGDSGALSDELSVADENPNNDDDGVLGTLTSVETNGIDICTLDNEIPAGKTITATLELFGNLDDAAMGQSISPVLTVSGSDEQPPASPPTP